MKKNNGQSLVEMVVAVGILVLVILALVALTTVSIHNASFSRNQALATKYAQEWIEEARKLRDTQPESDFFVDKSCSASDVVGIFTRTRTCKLIDENTMEVKVIVSWADAKGTHKSELTTYLTKWK